MKGEENFLALISSFKLQMIAFEISSVIILRIFENSDRCVEKTGYYQKVPSYEWSPIQSRYFRLENLSLVIKNL